MKTVLTWKKGIFSNTYNIYNGDQLIGKFRNNWFSQSADGELNGVKYTFKTRGFFKQHTQIIEDRTGNIIGEINYSTWRTKATLSINDKESGWKYDNIWNTRWSIFNSEGLQINYCGSSTRGTIESNSENDLLLLGGLFVTNYYWQTAVVLIIIFCIPVWTSI